MDFSFGIFSIGYRQPNPFHPRVFSHIPKMFCAFTFLKQGNYMCTSHFVQDRKIHIFWTMKQGKTSAAHFDEVDARNVLHWEFNISAICITR
jgi:hypothetical protein